MNTAEKVYCGIDVSKHHLDVMIKGQSTRFDNTVKGIESMKVRVGNVHYVFESTGGYERLAAWLLMDAGADVSIVNPARVRMFALGIGQLAKTDPIDAGGHCPLRRCNPPCAVPEAFCRPKTADQLG